jgi:uncharacterized membrane protein YhaH (DUF805 family)
VIVPDRGGSVSETFPQWERGAPYWVWLLWCLQTTLLIIATVRVGVFGLAAVADGTHPTALLVVLLYAVLPMLTGLLTRAWRRRRAWSWWVLVALSALGCAYSLLELLLEGPGVGVVVGMAVNTLFLVLLSRPSSRRWIRPAAQDRAQSAVS